ncbi:MAG: PKD domain-containing protein, partial [Flammeovirgaceae bacterium]
MNRTLTNRIHLVFVFLMLGLSNMVLGQDATISVQLLDANGSPSAGPSAGDACGTARYEFSAANIPQPDSTYVWNLDNGSGNITTDLTPEATYAAPGTYMVTLQIGDGSCGTCRDTVYVRVYNNPTIDFNADFTSVCKNNPVEFTPSVFSDPDDSITSYEWTFGDGDLVNTDSMPTHVYTQVQDYKVSLRITTENGCTDFLERNNYITVLNTATADFEPSTNTPVCLGDPVSFTNNSSMDVVISGSTGSITGASWDFGDGNTSSSTATTVNHTYLASGTYDVSLAAIASTGCNDTIVRNNIVTVFDPFSRINAFGVDTVCAGDIVPLTAIADSAAAQGVTVTSWDWTFVGANTGNATGVTINPTFSNGGLTTIQVTPTFSNGCVGTTSSVNVFVRSAPTVEGTSGSDVNGCLFDTIGAPFFQVDFGIVAAGSRPGTYTWNYGDATSTTGDEVTQNNITHTYSAVGSYDVTLTYIDANGCSATDMVTTVTVDTPVVSFTAVPMELCVDSVVTFAVGTSFPVAAGNITTYEWDYDDGGGFQAPVAPSGAGNFAYPVAGEYQPQLRVTTNDGCQSTYTLPEEIIVVDQPVIDSIAIITTMPACGSDNIFFEVYFDTTGGLPIADSVIFVATNLTDGTAGQDQSVTEIAPLTNPAIVSMPFTSIGQFSITATAFRNTCAAVNSYTLSDFGDTVEIHGTIAGFTMNGVIDGTTSSSCAFSTREVTVTNTSQGTDNVDLQDLVFEWDFGGAPDGTSPITTQIHLDTGSTSLDYIYAAAGSYTVTLTATDTLTGCTDVTTFTANVGEADAAITLTPNGFTATGEYCRGATINLAETSSLTAATVSARSWTIRRLDPAFGFTDVNNTSQNFDYTFEEAGEYEIQLDITTNGGCTFADNALLRQLDTIIVRGPNADFSKIDLTGLPFCLSGSGGFPGQPVQFLNTASDTNTIAPNGADSLFQWSWDYGDGSGADVYFAQVDTVSHTYTAAGTYDVTLTVTDGNGCSDSHTITSVVDVVTPSASFTVSDTFACLEDNRIFTFTSNSTGGTGPYTYTWDVDDPAFTSTNSNSVTHTYVNGSSTAKTVSLTITDANGCTSSASVNITVFDVEPNILAPVLSSGSLCSPATYDFDVVGPLSGGAFEAGTTFFWDFFDSQGGASGNKAFEEDPSNTFNNVGTFFPQVIITSPNGCSNTYTAPATVVQGPTGTLSVVDNTLCLGDTAEFFARLVGTNVEILTWDFGDGQSQSGAPIAGTAYSDGVGDLGEDGVVGDSVLAELDYPYQTQPGIFAPSIIVEDSFGCQNTILMDDGAREMLVSNAAPTSFLTDLNGRICVDTDINLTDDITPDAETQSNDQSPSVLLPNVDTVIWDFDADNATGVKGSTLVDVNGIGIAGGVFGTTNTDLNPTIQYSDSNRYRIQVTTITEFGCVNTYDTTVRVIRNFLAAAFTNDEVCLGDSISFTDGTTSTGGVGYPNADTWFWDFGDGDSTTVTGASGDVRHLYGASGAYDVILVASNSESGCTASDTVLQSVSVFEVNAAFNIDILGDAVGISSGTGGVAEFRGQFTNVTFDGSPSSSSLILGDTILDPSGFIWDLGREEDPAGTTVNGDTITGINYDIIGVDTVTLIVQSVKGCTDTLQRILTIQNNPPTVSQVNMGPFSVCDVVGTTTGVTVFSSTTFDTTFNDLDASIPNGQRFGVVSYPDHVLDSVEIVSQPSSGYLSFNNVQLVASDYPFKFAIEDAGMLRMHSTDATNPVTFTWRAYDSPDNRATEVSPTSFSAPDIVSIDFSLGLVLDNNNITADQTICEDSIPMLLDGSVPINGIGVYTYQWEQTTTFSGGAPTGFVNATPGTGDATSEDFQAPALTTTTYYRRVVTSGGCVDTSNYVTITVHPPIVDPTVYRDYAVCEDYTSFPLAALAATGGSGAYTYQWQSANDPVGPWTDIADATSSDEVYIVPAGDVVANDTIYYRRITSSTPCTAFTPGASEYFAVAAYPVLVAPVVAPDTIRVCSNTTSPGSFIVPTPTGGDGTYSYQWEVSFDGSSFVGNAAGTSTGQNYTPDQSTYINIPGLTTDTIFYFRRNAFSPADSTGACSSINNDGFVLEVYPAITGAILAPDTQRVCINQPAPVALQIQAGTLTGGDGDYSFQWQVSADTAASWVVPTGTSTDSTYSVTSTETNIDGLRLYRLLISSATPACDQFISDTIAVVVLNEVINNSIGFDQTVCFGNQPDTINELIDPTGGTGSIFVSWEQSLDNVSWTTANGTSLTSIREFLPTPNLDTSIDSIFYRRILSSTNCQTSISTPVLIRFTDPIDQTAISPADTVICNGADITITGPTTTGGSGTVTYQWQESADGSTYTDISGATNADLTVFALTTETFYRRVASSSDCDDHISAAIRVRMAIDDELIGTDQSLCLGQTTLPTVLTGTEPTANITGDVLTYQWQNDSVGSFVNVTGADTFFYAISTPIALPVGVTQYRRITNSVACPTVDLISNIVNITVVDSISDFTISANQTICDGDSPADLVGLTPTGGTGAFTYQWQSSTDNVTWSNESDTDQTFNPGALSVSGGVTTTYFYRLVASSGACADQVSNTVTITVEPGITNSILANQTICATETPAVLTTDVLSGGTGSYTFQWQFRNTSTGGVFIDVTSGTGTTETYTFAGPITETTNYRRLVSDGTCSDVTSNSITITVEDAVVLTDPVDQTICSGNNTNIPLVSDQTGTLYTWTATLNTGAVTGFSDQTTPVSAGSIVQTLNTTTASSSVLYRIVPISGSGANCVGDTVEVVVNVDVAPTVTATNSGPVCEGDAVALTATPGVAGVYMYNWTGPNGFSSTAQNPAIASVSSLAAGTYTVTITNSAGTCSDNDATTLTVNSTPAQPTINAVNASICEGDTIVLYTLSTCSSYQWIGPDGEAAIGGVVDGTILWTSNDTTFIPPTSPFYKAGQWSVRCVNASSCVSADSDPITIEINTQPTSLATNSGPVCSGEDVTFFGNDVTGGSYQWFDDNAGNPGNLVSTNQNFTVSGLADGTHDYYLVVTANGCPSDTSSTTATVDNVLSAPTILVADDTVCEGGSIVLSTSTVADTYQWTGPNGFSSTEQNPPAITATELDSGYYTLSVTISGCGSALDSVFIGVDAIPETPTISGPTTAICDGDTLLLRTSGSCASYQWIGPAGSSATTLGSLSDPNNVLWTTGDTTLIPSTSPFYLAGEWSVRCVSADGCFSEISDPITIEINTLPVISADNNGPVCEGDDAMLVTNTLAGATYTWTGPNSFTSNEQNPTISNVALADSGYYYVTASVNGCASATDSTFLAVRTAPTITVSDTTITCLVTTIDLTVFPTITGGTGPFTYQWTGPNSYSSLDSGLTIINATGASSGIYNLVVTDFDGCAAAPVTVEVDIQEAPAPPNITPDGPLCEGDVLEINVDAYSGDSVIYVWEYPSGFLDTTLVPTLIIDPVDTTHDGDYTVFSVVDGCVSPSEVTNVQVFDIPPDPAPVATYNANNCSGDTLILSTPINDPRFTYTWSGPNGFTASGDSVIIPVASSESNGTYTLTLTNGGICSSSASVVFDEIVETPEAPVIQPIAQICEGNSIELNVTAYAGDTVEYIWTLPDLSLDTTTTPTLIIDPADTTHNGVFSVFVIVDGCPSQPEQTNVDVLVQPSVPDITFTYTGSDNCEGDTLILTSDITDPTFTYAWTGPNGFSATDTMPMILNAGTAYNGSYSLTVSNGSCTATVSETYTEIKPRPATPSITSNEDQLCEGELLELTVVAYAGDSVSYNWTLPNASTVNQATPTLIIPAVTFADHNGSFEVEVYVDGCTSLPEQKNITINNGSITPAITVNNDTIYEGGTLVLSTATAADSYQWTGPNGFSSTDQNPAAITPVSFLDSGFYYLQALDANNCTSNTDSIFITVLPVPKTVDDVANTDEDEAVTIDVLANDSDIPSAGTLTVTTAASNGTAVVNDMGTPDPSDDDITYTPDPDFTGTDTFQYTLCDDATPANCSTATVTVNVGATVDAVNDVATVSEDDSVNIDVLVNDLDVTTSGTLTLGSTAPTNGTVTVEDPNNTPTDPSDDVIKYVPNPDFNGLDTFNYIICDADIPANCDSAVVIVTVEPEVDAVDDVATTFEDEDVTIDVLANDLEVNADGSLVGLAPVNGTVSVIDPNLTPTDPSDDQIVYTPNPDFNGLDSFTYRICDSDNPAHCSEAQLVVTVTPTPDAVDDVASTDEELAVTIDILANDNDTAVVASLTIIDQPENGTVAIDDNGTPGVISDDSLIYTPDADFTGVDTLIYEICDGASPAHCSQATVVINVGPAADAINDVATVSEDDSVNIDVLANDMQVPSTGTLSIGLDAADNGTTTVEDPNNTPNDPSDDVIKYVPNPDFNGTDTFSYIICDAASPAVCDTAEVVVTVEPEVDANPDVATTFEDESVTVDVLANDSEVPTDGELVALDPANGTVVVIDPNATPDDPSDDEVVYTPDADFNGVDTVIYRICDSDNPANCDTDTLIVTVTPTPDAVDDVASTDEELAVTIDILAN